MASRSVLSKYGIGLRHSVIPSIGGSDLQCSIIFDLAKVSAVRPTLLKFMTTLSNTHEPFAVAGRSILLDHTRRIFSVASMRGKIGGKITGMKIHNAFSAENPTDEQRKIIADTKIGGKSTGIKIHNAFSAENPTDEQRRLFCNIKVNFFEQFVWNSSNIITAINISRKSV